MCIRDSRGVAGTIFVHKILGHAAREGKSLAEIKDLADKIVTNIHTIGLALSGATVPEVGKPGFCLLYTSFMGIQQLLKQLLRMHKSWVQQNIG